MTTLVVLQPSFLPWIGYFDLINQADIFVFLDDVQYTKQDWRNRNCIKISFDAVGYITVPVLGDHHKKTILETRINNQVGWQKKMLRQLKYSYQRSPFFLEVMELLQPLFEQKHEKLSELNCFLTKKISAFLGISSTKFFFSSQLSLSSYNSPTERLLLICDLMQVSHYLTGDAAKNYLEEGVFRERGIELSYHGYCHPSYSQFGKEFVPYLSIIDLLFNLGSEASSIIVSKDSKNKGDLLKAFRK